MRVGADEPDREVEVPEDLRRVDGEVALRIDGRAEQLQVEGVRVLVTPSDEAPARRLLAEAAAGDEGDRDG